MSCKDQCCESPLPVVALDYAGVEKIYTYPSCGYALCTNVATDGGFTTSYGGGNIECEIVLDDGTIVLARDAELSPDKLGPPKWQTAETIPQFAPYDEPAVSSSFNRETCQIENTHYAFEYTEIYNNVGGSNIDTDDGYLKYICISDIDIELRITNTWAAGTGLYTKTETASGNVSWYNFIQYEDNPPTVDQGTVSINSAEDYYYWELYGTTCGENATTSLTYEPPAERPNKSITRFRNRWKPLAPNEDVPIPSLEDPWCGGQSFLKQSNGQILAYNTIDYLPVWDKTRNLYYVCQNLYWKYNNSKSVKIDGEYRVRFSRPTTCYFKAWFTVTVQTWKSLDDIEYFSSYFAGESEGSPTTTEHTIEWEESGDKQNPCIDTDYGITACENFVTQTLDFVTAAEENQTITVCLKKWSILKDYEPIVECTNPIINNIFNVCKCDGDVCKRSGLPAC